MKLIEICEELFQYVCLLNRSARKGAPLEPNLVRQEIKSLLAKTRQKASADPLMAQQYDAVERPLIYFIDFMIEESALPFAGEWKKNRLQNEMYSRDDGDDDFFDLLDDTLEDTRPEATERLLVYYTCMGLGFSGFYKGNPEYLREKMNRTNARIRELVTFETGSRIVPESYEHVDQSNLIQPPTRSLVSLVVAVVAVVISLLVFSVFLYSSQTSEMMDALEWTELLMKGEAVEPLK